MNNSKLSEVAEIISGGTPKTDIPEYWDGDIGWLSIVDFGDKNKYVSSSEKTITQEGLEHSTTKILHPNDIIISARGTVGAMAMTTVPMAFNQSCFGLRANPNILNQDFLFYYLKSYLKGIDAKTQGSVFSTINLSTFDMLEISYPDKGTQDKIASILSLLDDKIENNNKINAELESMVKTIYDYWFLQFEFPNEEGKPYKSSGGKMVWNEELKREIPEGWEVKNILDVCDIIDCLHSKKPEYCYEEDDCYLLTTDNLSHEGYIDATNKYYISRTEYQKWIKNIEVMENDFVITNAGRAGDFAKIPNGIKCALGRNLTAIRPQNIDPYYLRQFMKSDFMKTQIMSNLDTGSFFSSFNVRSIKNISILVPDMKTLNITRTYLEKAIVKIENTNKENQELVSLRDFLLPLLMNGQVGFKDE